MKLKSEDTASKCDKNRDKGGLSPPLFSWLTDLRKDVARLANEKIQVKLIEHKEV